MLFKGWRRGVGGLLVAFAIQAGAAAAAAPDSARLGRAKDYIADEQWTRAIAELRTVVADPKEKSRDEALYWLAHSLNQAGDSAAAITTIRRLEREYPTSLWVKPAGSLRVDIAVHLQRSDVLWWMAVPPAPPAPAAAACTARAVGTTRGSDTACLGAAARSRRAAASAARPSSSAAACGAACRTGVPDTASAARRLAARGVPP